MEYADVVHGHCSKLATFFAGCENIVAGWWSWWSCWSRLVGLHVDFGEVGTG